MKNLVNFPGIRVDEVDFLVGKKGPYAVINGVETKTGSSYQFLAYDEISEFAKNCHIRKGDHLNVMGYMQRYTKHLDNGTTDMRTSIIIQNLYNMGGLGEKKQMANSVCFFDLEILPQSDGTPYKISGNGPLVISTHEPSVNSQRIKLVAFDGMIKNIQDMQLKVGDHICVKGTLQKYEMQAKDGRKTYPVTCKIAEIERLAQSVKNESKIEELPKMAAKPTQNGLFSSTPKKSFG